jgi:sec-independent protein translocase protein TatB
MFDIGWSELVVIGVVALIAIGPKELPGVLRTVGQYMGKVRRMASEFQGQFQEAMREAEMADIKKSVDEMTESAKGLTNFDPLGDVKNEIDSFTSDPLGASKPAESETAAISETAASASPEAASPAVPAPVSSDASIPSAPQGDTAIAPEAPQPHTPEPHTEAKAEPQPETKSETKLKSGSGA